MTRPRILDVGCGDGLFFERLEQFGRVEGLEPDASIVRDPRWRDRIWPVALGSNRDRRVSGPYDLILMLDVLEHIADDIGALKSARDLLGPGGCLLLTVPALPWLWSRHDEINEHQRRYDPQTLRSALATAELHVQTVRFFFCWTVLPLIVRRWVVPADRDHGHEDEVVRIPPRPINQTLTILSRCEHDVGRVIRWPVGSSLLAIARRDDKGL
jgi:SAM-dependent methyltransferase